MSLIRTRRKLLAARMTFLISNADSSVLVVGKYRSVERPVLTTIRMRHVTDFAETAAGKRATPRPHRSSECA